MRGGGLRIGEEDVMSGGGAEVGIHGGVTIMSLCTHVPNHTDLEDPKHLAGFIIKGDR